MKEPSADRALPRRTERCGGTRGPGSQTEPTADGEAGARAVCAVVQGQPWTEAPDTRRRRGAQP